MALTEKIIRDAQPRDKAYTLSDGRGLLCIIKPTGAKSFAARIFRDGKETRRGLGSYPDVSLREARIACANLRQEQVVMNEKAKNPTLNDVYAEWLDKVVLPSRSEGYVRTIKLRFNKYIAKSLGKQDIKSIAPKDVLNLCHSICDNGYVDTANRVKGIISGIYSYAIITGVATSNPCLYISQLMQTHIKEHYATITDEAGIAMLLKKILAYDNQIISCMLMLSAHTFCRPSEIRLARWQEINLDTKQWIIKPARMKMKREHLVPLSSQVIELLQYLRTLHDNEEFLFPATRSKNRTLSDAAARIALRAMGYSKDQMTPHGFRAMASTIMNKYEWNPDVIETQLAHSDRNSVRSAYNHAVYMQQRVMLMQWWSDFLTALIEDKHLPSKPSITITI